MFGKLLVASALTVSLTACGGGGQDAAEKARSVVATASGAAANQPTTMPTVPATAKESAAASCPTESTKKFAKTRFVADAGLAFGVFNKWILKPYKAGSFNNGASGRKKTIAKAVAAGAFSLNRLNAARKLINADPTLCKTLKAPIEALWSTASGAIDKLKSGDTSAIPGAGSAIDNLKSQAGQQGLNIKDKTGGGF